jgi:hypothetical protein
MRWHETDLDAIDAFAQAVGVDRTEAIRRLTRAGLAAVGESGGRPAAMTKRKRRKPPQQE